MASINIAHLNNGITLSINGEFTFPINREFRETYSAYPKSSHFFVDLNNASYIDSAGLGMLLRLKEFADKQGTKVTLLCTNQEVLALLTTTRFDKLFTIE